MNIICSIIGPIAILILGIFYVLLILSSLYLVVKHEKGLSIFLWILLVLIFPFMGSLIYLGKHFITNPASKD